MLDEATKQAILSAIRVVLVAAGSVLTTKGVVDAETVNTIIGAAMVILPAVWGIYDRFQTARRAEKQEMVAVNAGMAKSDQTAGPTRPAASPAEAKAIVREYSYPDREAPG